MDSYPHHPFLKPFPRNSYNEIEKCMTNDILALRPTEYIKGLSIQNTDYVFTISNKTPPPILIDKKEHQFNKAHLIVYPPDTLIQTNIGGQADKYTCINIKTSYIEDIAKQITGSSRVFNRLQNPCSSSLLSTIKRLFYEIDNYGGTCRLMLQSIGMQLAIEILRNTGVVKTDDKRLAGPKERAVEIACEYIHSYYSADISIDDICSLVSLNRYYFIRLFKECTGRTPYDYLISVRLEEAKALLEKNQHSVEEAAGLCGFVSTSHFISSFRKAFGLTPGQYKKLKG